MPYQAAPIVVSVTPPQSLNISEQVQRNDGSNLQNLEKSSEGRIVYRKQNDIPMGEVIEKACSIICSGVPLVGENSNVICQIYHPCMLILNYTLRTF